MVVRRARIREQYPGGWDGFVRDCPNQTLCADSDLARVGFMAPADVENFCRSLEVYGFIFQRDNKAIDFAVVDQLTGPTTPCDWLEFGILLDGNEVAACRMPGSQDRHVLTPDRWRYEGSLSARFTFVPGRPEASGVVFLRHEDGIDVYFNRLTKEEGFMGRTSPGPPELTTRREEPEAG